MATVRDMVDLYAPQISLLCKLSSIVVHIDEGMSSDGHDFDMVALRGLLADREVQQWIEGMTKAGFAPVKRKK